MIFLAVRVDNLPMVRTRFALVDAEFFGAPLEETWAAQRKLLPSYVELRDLMTEKLRDLLEPAKETLN